MELIHFNGLRRARAVCCCVEQSTGAASAACAACTHAVVKVQNSLTFALRSVTITRAANRNGTSKENGRRAYKRVWPAEHMRHTASNVKAALPPTAPLTHVYIYCNASWDCFLKKKHQ